jgi:hypothetical protein
LKIALKACSSPASPLRVMTTLKQPSLYSFHFPTLFFLD